MYMYTAVHSSKWTRSQNCLSLQVCLSKSISFVGDIRKAFDCVNHTILLDKLDFYGIKGKFKNLLKSYLTGRYQKVIITRSNLNSNSSEWEGINSGVPQGSVLGPLLFLLYINDLPSVIPKPNRVVLFADDTSILINDPNV